MFTKRSGFQLMFFLLAVACGSETPESLPVAVTSGSSSQGGYGGASSQIGNGGAVASNTSTGGSAEGGEGGAGVGGSGGTAGAGGSGSPPGFAPCGGKNGKLWAWTWAGETGQYATVIDKPGTGLRITQLDDLSGNGNHFHNLTGNGEPGYQIGLVLNGYKTALPIIALNKYSGGKQLYMQYLFQDKKLSASGGFYLAFAGMNSRNGGQREMWGSNASDNVRLDQERDRVNASIGGKSLQLTDDNKIDKGPLVLEVFRSANGAMSVIANGKKVGLPVLSKGVFELSGTGWDGSGSSGWDDYAFEYIVCKGAPTQAQRDAVRSYLNGKWNIY